MFTGNNISKTKILQGKRTNTGTELDQLKETHDSYKRTTFKDIGAESGVTVGFKTKSLKAVTVKREMLPRKLLKTIDKCKFKQENLELMYNCSQFVGRRRRTANTGYHVLKLVVLFFCPSSRQTLQLPRRNY